MRISEGTARPGGVFGAAPAELVSRQWNSVAFLSATGQQGKLDAEIAAVRSMTATTLADRAATELIAGAEIWRSHFETAAPVIQMLAANYPAHHELNTTASSLFRSLGQTEPAARISDRLSRSNPRDSASADANRRNLCGSRAVR